MPSLLKYKYLITLMLCLQAMLFAKEKKMDMDKQSRVFLDVINALSLPPLETWSIEDIRKDDQNFWGYQSTSLIKNVKDISIPGAYGNIPLRIYLPLGEGNFPVMVTFHGGGWMTGSLKANDGFCREVCNHVQCIVVSVDYRLAPEFPFPVPVEECYTATEWVVNNILKYQGDPNRIAISGDSAGGNLAAAVTLMARDRGILSHIRCQVLIYPVLDDNFERASYIEFANDHLLTKNQMQFFWKNYFPSKHKKNPYAAPLQEEDLKKLPQTLVIQAYFDPLCDDSTAYAKSLRKAGVDVELLSYPTIHAFMSFADRLSIGKAATDDVIAYLQKALVREP